MKIRALEEPQLAKENVKCAVRAARKSFLPRPGIEPGTYRTVIQRLNHCATGTSISHRQKKKGMMIVLGAVSSRSRTGVQY